MKKSILLVIVLVFNVSLIKAQTEFLDTTAFVKGKAVERENNFKAISFTPSGNGNLSNLVSNASLTSSLNEGENGKIELKYDKDWLTFGLSVNQSISKKSKEASPFNLDGINNGTTIELNIQKMFWNPVVTESYFEKFVKAKHDYAIRLSKDERMVTLDEILKDTTGNEKELIKDVVLKQPWFFNISCSFNKNNYKYATDSISLMEITDSYISPNFKLSIGKPIANKNGIIGFIGISYSYSISYSSGDELTLLAPFGTTTNYLSKTLSFGEPEKKIDSRINIEWRRIFSNSIAISPNITYGLNSKKIAILLPMYFIKSSSKLLQGGIRLGYASATNDKLSSLKDGAGAEIIITTPFDIFENLKK